MANESEGHDEDVIHRVDTVPPPDGDDDAYNAATRIGPLAEAAVKEMMVAAEAAAPSSGRSGLSLGRREAEAKAPEGSKAPNAPTEAKEPAPAQPKDQAPAEAKIARSTDEELDAAEVTDGQLIARTYDEADEDDNAATMLSLTAKAPPAKAPPLPKPRSASADEATDAPFSLSAGPSSSGAAEPPPASTPHAPDNDFATLVALARRNMPLVIGIVLLLVAALMMLLR
jgi:hypothetical protein